MQDKHNKKKQKEAVWSICRIKCAKMFGQSAGKRKKPDAVPKDGAGASAVEQPHTQIQRSREYQPDEVGEQKPARVLADAEEKQRADGGQTADRERDR